MEKTVAGAVTHRDVRRRRQTFWAILFVAGLDVLLWAAFALPR
jgi:hypothetical protein